MKKNILLIITLLISFGALASEQKSSLGEAESPCGVAEKDCETCIHDSNRTEGKVVATADESDTGSDSSGVGK